MTNLEVIQHLIGSNATIPDSRIVIACQLLDFDSSDSYDNNDQSLKCLVYKVAIEEIMLDSGKVKRETEGGYTKEYIDSTNAALQTLANASGCQDLIDLLDDTPIVRNASRFW